MSRSGWCQFLVLLIVVAGLTACGGGGGGTSPPPQVSVPQITTQPGAASIQAGQSASFSVVAQGGGTLTYQWQRAASAPAAFQDIAGANAASYTLATTTAADNGTRFRVVVGNAGGSATSSEAVLTVSVVDVRFPTADGPFVTKTAAGTAELFLISSANIGGTNRFGADLQAFLADC